MKPKSNPFRRSAAIAASIVLTVCTADATVYTWDGGAATTNWTDANNWNANGAQAPLGVTGAHRLNINSTQKVIYNYTTATTTYTGDTVTGGGRGLVIGSGTNARGELEITAGTFSTLGAIAGDVIGNGSGAIGTLTISGGTFLGTNAGTSLGIGGGPTSTLNVSAGLAKLANLNMNATTATANLTGGTLEVYNITRAVGTTGNLNLSGGTLKARQDSTSFVSGLSAVNVNSGGAIIDSAGFNITIGNILRDGGGGGGLTKNSAGTLTLTAAGAYTGTTTISGGTLELGNGTTDGSIATSSGILNNAALAYNVVGSHSYANVISGTGSVSKAAAGSITLSNTNTYQGATSVTGGTFALTGTGSINNSSGITVNGSGAKFLAESSVAVSSAVTLTNGTLTGSGTVNTVNLGAGTGGIISNNNGVAGAAFNIGALTLAGGANITLYSNGTDTSSVLNVTTLTNNSAASEVTLTANNTLGWTNGATYTLIDYGTLGGTGGYNFNKVANNLSGRQIGTFTDTGSAITLGITGDSVFWTGAANANWNTSDTNWELLAGATATQFIATDDVIFNDSASGNTTIDIDAAPVATNTVVFDNTTGTSYTINSSNSHGISAGILTKNNSGTVTLNTANTYTGGTFLNAGTLNIGNAAALGGAASALTISGGTLDNTSGGALTTANHQLTINGDFTFTGSNDLNLGTGAASLGTAAGTSRAITTTAGTLTIGGSISDGTTASGLTKNGNGTLVLGGANDYTGLTTINGGIVKAGNASALGSTTVGTVINAGGTFDINGVSLAGEAFELAGGKLTNTGAEQINAIGGAVTVTANSQIGGTTTRWDIRKVGSSLTVNSGVTLTKVDANEVGVVGRTLVNDGVIQIDAGLFSLHTGGSYGGSGTYTVNANGTLSMGAYGSTSGVTIANNILSNGGTISSVNAGGSTPLWSGQLTLAAATTTKLKATNAGNYAGNIVGDGALEKTDVSIFTLSGTTANTYTGLTTISAGTLEMNKTAGVNAIGGNVLVGAGTLSNTTDNQIADTSTVTLNDAAAKWTINNRVETVANVDMQNAGTTTSTGLVTGVAGKLAVTGTLTLTLGNITLNSSGVGNESTISAGTLINTGGSWTFGTSNGTQSLVIGSGGLTIGGGSTITVANSAASPNFISLGGNVTSQANANSNTIAVSGSNTAQLRLNASRTFDVADGAATNDLVLSTILADGSGTGAVVKDGAGTMRLTGANSYTGNTTITAGTLEIGGSLGSGSYAGDVAIASGALFSFNSSSSQTLSGDLSGLGALSKAGSGTLTLTGDNSYSGDTTITAGILAADSTTALDGGSAISVASGATLRLGASTGSGSTVTINGTGSSFYGALQGAASTSVSWEGNVVLGSNEARIGGGEGGTLTIGGVISDGGNGHAVLFSRAPNSTTILNSVNTYTGDTLFYANTSDVTLKMGIANAIDSGSRVRAGTGSAGGNEYFDLNGYNQNIRALVDDQNANLIVTNNSSTDDAVLTLSESNAANSASFNGWIQDGATNNVSLVKTGAGTQILSGPNTYTGDTTISGGKLVINGDSSLATGEVSVASGATLGGIGTVGGATTISGTHAPGNSPGVQSFSSDLSYASTSIFEWDLASSATGSRGTQYDGVNVGGTLSGTTGAAFRVALGAGAFTDTFWNSNQSWTDIFKSGVDGSGSDMDIASVFSAIQWYEGTTDMTSSTGLDGYFTISGSSLNWTAVPEPTSALVGLLIGAGLLRRRRVA